LNTSFYRASASTCDSAQNAIPVQIQSVRRELCQNGYKISKLCLTTHYSNFLELIAIVNADLTKALNTSRVQNISIFDQQSCFWKRYKTEI